MSSITAADLRFSGKARAAGRALRLLRDWRRRAKLRRLRHFDDRTLDDMGITRDELAWASGLPLRVNAALALEERAGRRRREEFDRLYAIPSSAGPRRAAPSKGGG